MVAVQNGCIIIRRDLETKRFAAGRYCSEHSGDVLGAGTAQRELKGFVSSFFFFFYLAAQYMVYEILVPQPRIEPMPLQ